MSNDKKDLSDLKARLGLKKPSSKSSPKKKKAGSSGAKSSVARPDKPSRATDGTARGSSGGHQEGPESDFFDAKEIIEPSQPVAPKKAPASPRPGPPPGAAGPPPTVRPKAAPQEPARASFDSGGAPEDLDMSDLGIEDEGGLGLSPPVVVLLVVLLGVGLFFGYMTSQSLQTRSIETARINDANSILQYLEPRFDALAEAEAIIDNLDPMDPDFAALDRLGELNFQIGGDVLPGNRLLLGSTVITPLNRFMAETTLLGEQVQHHVNYTNSVDRDEIEGLMAEKEEYMEEEVLGVVFHHFHIGGYFQDRDNYTLPDGRLVFVRDMEQNDEGMIEIQMMGRDNTNRVEAGAVVLLDRDDLLRTEGENAVTRHGRRVNELKVRAEGISRRVTALRTAVETVAHRDMPPLFSFAGSSSGEGADGNPEVAPEEAVEEAE